MGESNIKLDGRRVDGEERDARRRREDGQRVRTEGGEEARKAKGAGANGAGTSPAFARKTEKLSLK